MEITYATTDDAAEILALQKRAFMQEAELYGEYDIEPLTVTLEETMKEFRECIVLKLIEGGRIAGSVRAKEEKGVCHINKLIVDPLIQNRGFGSALMKRIEKEFSGCKKFELYTGYKSENNKHLYTKLGYIIKETKMVHGNLGFVYMEKSV
jgi:ribosomal protein S18 acetylase RimI-like enzyme